MTTAFYLKYRPQKFSDLDATEAREQLEKIFASGKVPHAFLFSGPKGIGKTSAARIVAKAINCEEVQRYKGTEVQRKHSDTEPMNLSRKATDEPLNLADYEPCNECDSCVSITNGTNMDVFEIDAASNRGIDDIKELRDKIKLAPSSSKYKVYIIDEVHMLTAEAFNALLKTLEEPPKHAIFILCTTDPEKLPKTITSRCQRINFKRASKKEIVEKLKKISQEEKIDFEEKALEEIAKLSDGSFRDANKILEQVSSAGKITEEEVKRTAGILGEFGIEEFLTFLQNGKTKEALLWINRAADQGANLKILTERIVDELRRLLLAGFGIKEIDTESEAEGIALTEQEIRFLIELFTEAYSGFRSAVIPQLPLEMAVVKWEENQFKVQSSKFKVGEQRTDSLGETGMKLEVRSGKLDSSEQKPQNPKIPLQNPVSHFSHLTSFSIEDVLSKWQEILNKVKPLNHSIVAFLKASRPVAIEEGFLILEVFYKFHKDQLETEKCRKIFEKAASEVLGSEIKLKCNLSQEKPPKVITKQEIPSTEKVADNLDNDIIKMAEEIFNK